MKDSVRLSSLNPAYTRDSRRSRGTIRQQKAAEERLESRSLLASRIRHYSLWRLLISRCLQSSEIGM